MLALSLYRVYSSEEKAKWGKTQKRYQHQCGTDHHRKSHSLSFPSIALRIRRWIKIALEQVLLPQLQPLARPSDSQNMIQHLQTMIRSIICMHNLTPNEGGEDILAQSENMKKEKNCREGICGQGYYRRMLVLMHASLGDTHQSKRLHIILREEERLLFFSIQPFNGSCCKPTRRAILGWVQTWSNSRSLYYCHWR